MPTIKNISDRYRFFFYSFDCNEPIHVHIQREKKVCKFWLLPVILCNNYGFMSYELNSIRKIIIDNQIKIEEAWSEHCSKYGRSTN
jgi:hypothetical protein